MAPDGVLSRMESLTAEFECAICSELMEAPITLPCGHSFCRGCLRDWVEQSPVCPHCRAPAPAGVVCDLAVNITLQSAILRIPSFSRKITDLEVGDAEPALTAPPPPPDTSALRGALLDARSDRDAQGQEIERLRASRSRHAERAAQLQVEVTFSQRQQHGGAGNLNRLKSSLCGSQTCDGLLRAFLLMANGAMLLATMVIVGVFVCGSDGGEAHSAFDVHPFGMMINGLVVGTCVWSTLTFGLGIYAAYSRSYCRLQLVSALLAMLLVGQVMHLAA